MAAILRGTRDARLNGPHHSHGVEARTSACRRPADFPIGDEGVVVSRTMTGAFDLATAVHKVQPTDRTARFESTVAEGWDIAGNANGGYLLGIAARAMAEMAGRPPLTVTAHYLAPCPAGPCHVDVTVVRAGRRLATLSAGLFQGDRQIMQVLGTFGEQQAQIDPAPYSDGAPPAMPSWDDSAPTPLMPIGESTLPPLVDQIDIRLRPQDSGFRVGEKTGRAEIAGWLGFCDGAPFDALGLLFACDAFPPPVFNTDVAAGWVPTVELTVHVRGVPAPGPVRCVFRSRFVQGGLLDEDGEIWDSSGNLVAQSRQLALVPRV